MPDYKKMYHIAFNAITDALEELDRQNFGTALELLKKAQFHTEDLYIAQGEDGAQTSGGGQE